MTYLKYIFLSALFLTGASNLLAQDLPSEEVEVIKDFEARLEDSEKINVLPELPELDSTSRSLTYQVLANSLPLEYLPPKIRPLAMRGDKVPPAYNAYLKLGYGLPTTPYAELAYNNSKEKTYDIGGHLKYLSTNRTALKNQRYRDISGSLYGNYFWDQGFAISGDMSYRLDEVHFYGYDHDVHDFSREEAQQQFKTFDAKARFFNGERTQGDINYGLSAQFISLNDNFASKENSVNVQADATKWFNENHPLTVILNTDFTSFKDTATQTLNNFSLKPSFTYHGEIFKVKVGVNLTSHKDNFILFPDAEVAVNVVGNKLMAFAGAEGGLYKNNFKNLSDYNPFIVSRLQIGNTDYNHFYGGVKGNLSIVDYKIRAGYKKANNMALFLTDPMDTVRLNVLYDTVSVFNIEGTLEAQPMKNLSLIWTLSQSFFDLSNEEEAWHLPAFETNLSVRYLTLKDKLTLKGELFAENGVNFRTIQGSTGKLNGLFDFNLGAEYQVTKNFSLFFDANNLLNNERERWFRYPIYGINILGGLTARF